MKTTTREYMVNPTIIAASPKAKAKREGYSEGDSIHQPFNDTAQLAATSLQMAVAFTGLLEEGQWQISGAYSAEHYSPEFLAGLLGHLSPADTSFTEISDLRKKDITDNTSDLAGGLVYFGAMPVKDHAGNVMGFLCVADTRPKKLTEEQRTVLQIIAGQVFRLVELGRLRHQLREREALVLSRNLDLEHFANIAAHDLKAPLSNISGLIDVMLTYYSEKLDQNVAEMLELIRDSSAQLRLLVDGILAFGKNNKYLAAEKESTHLPTFFRSINNTVDPENLYRIRYHGADDFIEINPAAMQQILIHLLTNAIRFNDKPEVEISLEISRQGDHLVFTVSDNGPGIEAENFEKIFNIFEIVALKDRFGIRGCGIGLACVKRLVEGQGGTIVLRSEPGSGTRFEVSIPA